MHDVVIVGAGMAGATAAMWCARLGRSFAWLESGDALGGQLANVHNPIVDYPGRATADGPEFAAVLAEQLEPRPRLRTAVAAADCAAPAVTLAGGERVSGRALLLCTGVRPRSLGVPGEEAALRSASRVGARARGRRALVVGGGDGAVEGAQILASHGAAHVTLVHRGPALRAREDLRQRLPATTEVLLRTTVRSLDPIVVAGPDGEQRLDADLVFVKIGFEPASELVAGQLERDAGGYVRCDGNQRTSAPAPVFAAGDVCSPVAQSLAVAGGQAAAAAKVIDSLLAAAD